MTEPKKNGADPNYHYPVRPENTMPAHHMRLGEGILSGNISLILGFLSLLAVFAYLFPSYLTTKELRAAYDAEVLQEVLKYGMYASIGFGLMSLVLGKKKLPAILGLTMTLTAFTLGGYMIPVGAVTVREITLGVDWLILAFLISAPLFIFLEKIFPLHKGQAILRPDWGLDFKYFCFNHLLISTLLFLSNAFISQSVGWVDSETLHRVVAQWPLWVQVAALILAADFVLYVTHRVFHEIPWLWKIHAVHHSTKYMDWMSGSRGHVLNTIIERCLVLVPLYLLGATKEALDIYVTIAAIQAVYIHTNANIPIGPLKYLIVTTQYHHWHHSTQRPAIDTNYCAHTPLFDWVFGTRHMPFLHWPAFYGASGGVPENMRGQLMHPFKRNKE